MIRFKRYRQKPKFQWKNYLNKNTWKYAAMGVGGVLLLVLLVLLFRGGGVSAEDTALYGKREIIVGVAVPSAFASVDNAGNITGFERDIAEAVLGSAYPGQRITFIAIESHQASYLLKSGEIDVAIGMYTEGVLKTQGLALTDSYFKDELCVFVSPGSAAQSLHTLNGKTIRVMSSEVKKSLIASSLASHNIETNISLCTSYTDGIADVLAGRAAALVVPRYKMASYSDLSPLKDSLGPVAYHMLLWKANSDAAALLSKAIAALHADGTLSKLNETWNIKKYTG